MKVHCTATALREIEEILSYLAARNPAAAAAVAARIEQVVAWIADFPRIGYAVENDVRLLPLGRYPLQVDRPIDLPRFGEGKWGMEPLIVCPMHRWCNGGRARVVGKAIAFVGIFVTAFCGVAIAGRPTGDNIRLEHDRAVGLARSGQVSEALTILNQLAREAPENLSVAWDRVLILTWAGRDAEAIRLYEQLPRDQIPDYVVEAVARVYRNNKQFPEALKLYHQAGVRVALGKRPRIE